MKILIVLLRLKGGVGRANTEIANSLRKKGHQVDILSREDHLKVSSLSKSIFPLRKKIEELMKENNYDFIYTQDYSMAIPLLFPYPLFWNNHFSCFCGIKTGKHPHLFQKHHKWTQYLVGKIMGKKLVVIGDSLKERFPKSKKIYRGVNIKEFTPLKKKRDSLGWIDTHSGRRKDDNNELISKQELQEISEKTGLKFIVAKNIPKNKMNDFYNNCKVFVNLPRTAGFNLEWLEAMAAGVPIIVGNDKGAGTFLPIEKVYGKNKVNKIIEILKKPKKINYRNWIIENNFTWDDKAQELEEFFIKNV